MKDGDGGIPGAVGDMAGAGEWSHEGTRARGSCMLFSLAGQNLDPLVDHLCCSGLAETANSYLCLSHIDAAFTLKTPISRSQSLIEWKKSRQQVPGTQDGQELVKAFHSNSIYRSQESRSFPRKHSLPFYPAGTWRTSPYWAVLVSDALDFVPIHPLPDYVSQAELHPAESWA
jgi:hypothetical protein